MDSSCVATLIQPSPAHPLYMPEPPSFCAAPRLNQKPPPTQQPLYINPKLQQHLDNNNSISAQKSVENGTDSAYLDSSSKVDITEGSCGTSAAKYSDNQNAISTFNGCLVPTGTPVGLLPPNGSHCGGVPIGVLNGPTTAQDYFGYLNTSSEYCDSTATAYMVSDAGHNNGYTAVPVPQYLDCPVAGGITTNATPTSHTHTSQSPVRMMCSIFIDPGCVGGMPPGGPPALPAMAHYANIMDTYHAGAHNGVPQGMYCGLG